MRDFFVKPLIFGSCLTILVWIGCLGIPGAAGLPIEPMVVDGELDLARWNPVRDGTIRLDGEWEFYWQELLGPDVFSSQSRPRSPAFFPVPGLWNGYTGNSNPWPGDGYATYHLKLQNLDYKSTPLAFYIREMPTAYRLWADGHLIAENGKVGKSERQMIPWYQPKQTAFLPDDSDIDLVLQVSNFFHKDGGVWYSLELGPRKDLFATVQIKTVIDLILFGALLIMGVYHLGLYALRPQDRTTLYFGLFCLLIGLRSVLVGQRIFAQLFPDVSWSIQQKMEFICLYGSVPCFCLFFRDLFPEEVSKKLPAGVTILCLIFSGIVLVTEVKVYAHTANILQIMIYLIAAYMVYCLRKILKLGREGGRLFAGGFVVILIASINDTLKTHFWIDTANLIHVAVFLFVFFQAFLISKKFSAAFTAVAEMKEELQATNRELIRINQVKDEFLANTSHELRTPLHGIIGIAESLQSGAAGELSRFQTKNLSLIISSGRRLYQLIQDLLDFSRMRRNDIELDLRPVDLKSVAQLVTAITGPLAAEKQITLTTNLPENFPAVLADENRLQQILFNLVGNAIKFTPSGRVEIHASSAGGKATICVTDTGVGIQPVDLQRVFQAFEQADGSLNRQHHGTGLGLTISRNLVRLHGSKLYADSIPGKGSTFSFQLSVSDKPALSQARPLLLSRRWMPGEVGEMSDSTAPVPDCDNPEARSSGETILVVDDEPVNRQLVYNHLKIHGYHVITACNGHECMERIKEEPPDLVLLDIMMPKMNGFAVCRKIRTNYDFYALPIILLSARNQLTDLVQGFHMGANDYLTKPFYREELLARIATHLKAREAVDQLKQNVRLKEEIQRRRVVEEELRISRIRLVRILDAARDPIIAVGETGSIRFYNQEAEQVFGYPLREVLYQQMDLLFPGQFETILQAVRAGRNRPAQKIALTVKAHPAAGDWLPVHLQATSCRVGKELLLICIVLTPGQDIPDSRYSGESAALFQNNEKQFAKMTALENAFSQVAGCLDKDKPENLSTLRILDPRMDEYRETLYTGNHSRQLRHLLVQTLNQALRLWEISTGKTKVDLAEESRIWKAYLDGGTWKTRTLDKYLKVKTLPQKPRWREVLRTAHFVLANCPLSEEQAARFQQLVVETEKWIHYQEGVI